MTQRKCSNPACRRTESEGAEFYEASSIRRCKACHRKDMQKTKQRKSAATIPEFIENLQGIRQDRWADRIVSWWEEDRIDKTQHRELVKWCIKNGVIK